MVNEVYLRLVDYPQRNWENRSHFLAICAQLMRRILVDFARSRNYQKRGGGKRNLRLDEALSVCNEAPVQIIAVDDALKNLAVVDARKSLTFPNKPPVELDLVGGFVGVSQSEQDLSLAPIISWAVVERDARMTQPSVSRKA